MGDSEIWGIILVICFVLGSLLGSIVGDWINFEEHFKHGYGQAIIDAKEGKPPRYKLFYRGDGTVTWIRTTTEVR